MSDSPYAPPMAPVFDDLIVAGTEAESIRQAHLRHEVQLKSVATLYFFVGTLLLLASLSSLWLLTELSHPPVPLFMVIGYAILAPIFLVIGYGFRRLRPWVRIPGSVISGIGLLGIPVGTLISIWVLYLMYGAKGRVILDPAYQQIIDATPFMRYRRTLGDWIATIIIVGLLLSLVVITAIGLSN